jgi:hypothetical protein
MAGVSHCGSPCLGCYDGEFVCCEGAGWQNGDRQIFLVANAAVPSPAGRVRVRIRRSNSRFEPMNCRKKKERRSPDRLVPSRVSHRADQEIGAPVHGKGESHSFCRRPNLVRAAYTEMRESVPSANLENLFVSQTAIREHS